MPTQTFFNLSNNKKEKIIKVAKDEFSKYSFYDASINRIIKNANISRGAFYLYFKNKEDIFLYILDQYRDELIKAINGRLENKKYDIFELLLLIFDFITQKSLNENHKDFIVMTLSQMNVKLATHLLAFMDIENMNTKKCPFIELVSTDNLNITSNQDLLYITDILRVILLNQITATFSNNCEIKQARIDLINKFNLIKHGILKKS